MNQYWSLVFYRFVVFVKCQFYQWSLQFWTKKNMLSLLKLILKMYSFRAFWIRKIKLYITLEQCGFYRFCYGLSIFFFYFVKRFSAILYTWGIVCCQMIICKTEWPNFNAFWIIVRSFCLTDLQLTLCIIMNMWLRSNNGD